MKIFRRKRHILLSIILIFSNFGVFSQIINPVPEKIFSASPDVMAFQKYNITEVNLYTGKTDVKIPIFEIKSGNINVPISINYDSGGIKVDDRATSVGMGWVLNAGGSIIRIVNDIPDNDSQIGTDYQDGGDTGIHIYPIINRQGNNRKINARIPVFATYYRYSNFPNDSPCFVYREDIDENEVDGVNGKYWADSAIPYPGGYFHPDLPDTFIVNAPGLSSKFITSNNTEKDIYPNNNNGITTTFLDNSGIKMASLVIDKRANPGYGFYNYVNLGENNLSLLNANPYHQITAGKKIKDFYEFNVVNTNGVKYKFNEEEVNETFYRPFGIIPVPGAICSSNGMDIINSYHANYYNKRIHTWNLSQIEDSQTNKTVDFLYQTYANPNIENNILVDTPVNLTIGSPQNENSLNKCMIAMYAPNDPYNYLKMNSMTKNPKRKRLTSISYEEGTVNFQYGLRREDYLGENALTEIIVKNNNNIIVKRFVLNYSYFNSKENCDDPDCKRLKLESIQIFGNDSKSNSYTFDYEYSNKLPKRGSLEHDFLGYYNNNGVPDNNSNVLLTPELYFYKNNYINSILPFQLANNNNFQIIPGNYSLIPNAYSLTGLLKKITYPSGGSSEFEYENNQFQYQGETYLSGGARIKSQKLTDNNNQLKKVSYSYLDQYGKSSGYINNIPKFANISDFYADTMMAKSFAVYDMAKGGIELTSGSFVGYSKITETEIDNGYTKYEFSSPLEFPNTPEVRINNQTDSNCTACSCLFIKNTSYPMMTFVDNESRRGKLINKTIYNSANQILDQEINDYSYRELKTFPYQVTIYFGGLEETCTTSHREGISLTIKSNLPVSQNLLTKKTNISHFNTKTLSTTVDYEYDSNFPFVTKEIFNNGLADIKTEKLYSYFSNQIAAQPIINNLVTANRINEVVTEKIFRDNNLITTKQINYKDFGNGTVLPKSLSKSVGLQVLEEQDVIDLRDNKGNILQYHNKIGVNTSIIWGYNKTQPIAKIDNAAYTAIPAEIISNLQTLSNNDSDNCMSQECSEQKLRKALNLFRDSVPNAFVSTYTYNPLVGVTSITDPKGMTSYYEYDEELRLKWVKDSRGKLLTENIYHYKN
ncbi:hypothetical protein [Flavobacterium olei]|uniref:hypothetical protein n=1 Tax=Flavobacterium olei TaxID=1886782 RepID=UPI00321BCDFD